MPDITTQHEDALDEALAHYHRTHPLWDYDADVRHLVNHGTMASDALVALGYGDHLPELQKNYFPDKLSAFALTDAAASEPAEFGNRAELSEWIGHYKAQLESTSIEHVIQAAVPKLMPGVIGGALHGLIRVAHALRMLARRDNVTRRRELAYGLGLWAAEWRSLPGTPGGTPVPGKTAALVLGDLPALPQADRRDGLITERAQAVESHADYPQHISQLDVQAAPLSDQLTDVAELACRLYLANPSARSSYLHATTATDALRTVLPLLDSAAQAHALGHFVQALGAVHAAHVENPPIAAVQPSERGDPSADAVATMNDHTIKFTETCLREHALSPRPAYLRAAWQAVDDTA